MTLIRKLLLATAVAIFGFVVAPTAVFADDVPPPPVTLDASDVSTFVIAAPIVSIIVGILIPFLNGLLTKLNTSSGIKSLLTALLAGVSALVTNGIIADGSSVFTTQTLYTFLATWGISVLAYNQLYKPLGVTSSALPSGAPGKLSGVGRHD